MKQFSLLFLFLGFLHSFSAISETGPVAPNKNSDPETEQLDSSKDNLETEAEKRELSVRYQDEALVLNPVESFSYSEKNMSNRFLEFGLEYPTSFGVNLRYLLTDSVYGRLGLGFMSGFFLNSFEKIADSFGYLSEEEAKLLADTIKNSIYLDLRLAWAPYLKSEGGGPYLELGLSHSRYGKGELQGLTLSQVLEDDSIDETLKYSAKTNTYNASFHVGYQIPLEKVKLNFEIGLIKIFSTELLDEISVEAPELLSDNQKKKFQDFLETRGWIFPTFSGWISFAF